MDAGWDATRACDLTCAAAGKAAIETRAARSDWLEALQLSFALDLNLVSRSRRVLDDHSITPLELLLLLAVFAGPLYLIASILQVRWLRRHHVPRAPWVAALSAVCALPLTVALWIGLGHLPPSLANQIFGILGPLGVPGMIGLPAVVASAVIYPVIAFVARQRVGAHEV